MSCKFTLEHSVVLLLSVGLSYGGGYAAATEPQADVCSWAVPPDGEILNLCPLLSRVYSCTYATWYTLNYSPFENGLLCDDNHVMVAQDVEGAPCVYLAVSEDTIQPTVYNGPLNPNGVEAYSFLYENGEQSGGCFIGRVTNIVYLCNAEDSGTHIASCSEERACVYDIVLESPYACAGVTTTTSTPTTTTSTTSAPPPPTQSHVYLLFHNSSDCEVGYHDVGVSGACSKTTSLNDCKDTNAISISSTNANGNAFFVADIDVGAHTHTHRGEGPPASELNSNAKHFEKFNHNHGVETETESERGRRSERRSERKEEEVLEENANICAIGMGGNVLQITVEVFDFTSFYFTSSVYANSAFKYALYSRDVTLQMIGPQEFEAVSSAIGEQTFVSIPNAQGVSTVTLQY